MRFLFLLAFAVAAQEVSQSGLTLKAERPLVAQAERAKNGMVASTHELASQAGIDIMKRGGNAVDAAVAVGFALAVVHPEAGNIAGGGYMLIRMADGRATAIDYKEMAPATANPSMYQNADEQRFGYKASAAGFALAHKKFGKLTWAQVLEPARLLAKNGFPASQRIEIILALQVPIMKQFPETAKVFLHGGETPLKQGEIVRQMDLAASLGTTARMPYSPGPSGVGSTIRNCPSPSFSTPKAIAPFAKPLFLFTGPTLNSRALLAAFIGSNT